MCRVRSGHSFSKVFLEGLFCGKGELSICDQLLKKFIIECRVLSGIVTIVRTECSFDTECFTCDTPARTFLKRAKVLSVFRYPCDSVKVGVAKCRGLGSKLYTVHVRKASKCLKVVIPTYVYVAKLLH